MTRHQAVRGLFWFRHRFRVILLTCAIIRVVKFLPRQIDMHNGHVFLFSEEENHVIPEETEEFGGSTGEISQLKKQVTVL